MTEGEEDQYTLERVREDVEILHRVEDETVRAVEGAADASVVEFLIEEQGLDVTHDGERGLGRVRRAVLESDVAPDRLKRLVSLRGDDTPSDVLVPRDVYRNAQVALEAGKPVVLYGPTGTGKTTFSKQLARESCVGSR